MNLLFIDLHCDALLPSGAGEFGGGNTYSNSVLKLISKNNDINCLYITRKKSFELKDSFNYSENIKYIRIKIGDYGYNDKDTLYLYTDSTFKTIQSVLEKQQFVPDIIHSSYWPSGLVALRLNEQYNAKQIHTVLSNGKRKLLESGHYSIENIRISAEQKIYDRVEHIICSSNAEYHDIQNLYNIPPEKLLLTGLDVDDAFRFPSYRKDGSFLINSLDTNKKAYIYLTNTVTEKDFDSGWWNDGAFLYFGRLHEDKGVLQVIECWLDLYKTHPDVSALWIAGGTPKQIFDFRRKVKDISTLIDAEKQMKLVWWGRISFEGISTLLLKSIAVITHSRYEAGGLMVLETMASGRPIVATPFGFAKHCIKNWENGFLVEFNNLSLLKLRMINLFMQPLLSSELGNNALMTFHEIDKEYDFRNKHLNIYGANISKSNDETLYANKPYPLYEVFPTESDIVRSFYNIYSQQNIINYCDISIETISNCAHYMLCKLNVNQRVFYCIRWKNHHNKKKVFYQTTKSFYTAFEQFNSNKLFLNNNSVIEKYFDESRNIIFLSADKQSLMLLKDNLDNVNFYKYVPNEKLTEYTYDNILFEINSMLKNYDFLFEEHKKAIIKFLDKVTKTEPSHGNLFMFPENIEDAYIIGDELIFAGSFVMVEKGYIEAVKNGLNKSNWSALLNCHSIMCNSIICGAIDADALNKVLLSLE